MSKKYASYSTEEISDVTKIKFKKSNSKAVIPVKNEGDAGYDLHITGIEMVEKHNGNKKQLQYNDNKTWDIFPGVVYIANTGLSCEMPNTYFGLVKPRSGMSANFGLNVLAGVVDSSYTGPLRIVFTVEIKTELASGDRIAQIVPIYIGKTESEEVVELTETERGDKGFGSSGR